MGHKLAGRRGRIVAIVLCAFVLLGFGVRRPAMVAIGDFLDVGEQPVAADLVYVLGGDIDSRPAAAADLYLRGYVPRIVMSRVADTPASRLGVFPNETVAARKMLIRLGVPDSAIVLLTTRQGVGSTTDEAIELRSYLDRAPADHILVLTNDYHTRRARWNLERQLEDLPVQVTIVGVPDRRFTSADWWRTEEGMVLYFEEYLKFLHNIFYR